MLRRLRARCWCRRFLRIASRELRLEEEDGREAGRTWLTHRADVAVEAARDGVFVDKEAEAVRMRGEVVADLCGQLVSLIVRRSKARRRTSCRIARCIEGEP